VKRPICMHHVLRNARFLSVIEYSFPMTKYKLRTRNDWNPALRSVDNSPPKMEDYQFALEKERQRATVLKLGLPFESRL
jgi:hypothetical protein